MLIISKNARSNYLIHTKSLKATTFKTKQEENRSAVCGMKSSAHSPFLHVLLSRHHLHLPPPSQVNRIFDANWLPTCTHQRKILPAAWKTPSDTERQHESYPWWWPSIPALALAVDGTRPARVAAWGAKALVPSGCWSYWSCIIAFLI